MQSSPITEDPVPAEARAVIELFATHLAKVQFPEVDAAALRKLADAVRAESAVVERAREALATAIAARDARVETLAAACARGVAYAKVFSDAQPDRQPIADALAALESLEAARVTRARQAPRPPAEGRTGGDVGAVRYADRGGALMTAGELNPPTR